MFVSGQIAIDPKTNTFRQGTIEEEAVLVLDNIKAILEASGSSLDHALKVTVYLHDLNDFAQMNAIYERYFTKRPARATIQAVALPKNAKLEIDVIAKG